MGVVVLGRQLMAYGYPNFSMAPHAAVNTSKGGINTGLMFLVELRMGYLL